MEQLTTQKKPNLILNVDGVIACAMVDLLRSCRAFRRVAGGGGGARGMRPLSNARCMCVACSKEEADEAIRNGTLNSLFVLGRSMGFIGHFLDQKRLKQGLYRHPWDDISVRGFLDVNAGVCWWCSWMLLLVLARVRVIWCSSFVFIFLFGVPTLLTLCPF